jgi:PAS domain S-box-containing protein
MPSLLIGVDKNGRVTQWNSVAEQTTGISTADAQGKTLSVVFPTMLSEMENIAESIRTRQIKQEQKRPPKTEKNASCEDVTIYPLVANGVEGAVIRIDDVTHKVRMEEMMIQTEKMMSVGGLAAGMAHELNNPLGGMLQGVQNVQRRLSPDLKSNHAAAEEIGIDLNKLRAYMEKREVLSFLDGIKESGRKASQIISNMLQFSRKSESLMAPTNLLKMLDNVLELAGKNYDLEKRFDFRNIIITREFAADLPLIPCTDTEIEQVILNLLRNAAWAMVNEKKGKPPQIILRVHLEDHMVRIEIEDNGPGMEEDVRKKIFEPFFTTKPLGEGTGLGLSVSNMIITNNHQGTLEVESEPGEGTKFIIRLPVERDS